MSPKLSRKGRLWAVVPAAGVGARLSANTPKQYLALDDTGSVLEHTLRALLKHPLVNQIVVPLSANDPYFPQLPISSASCIHTVEGGEQRHHSVYAALEAIKPHAQPGDYVLVHDAVRPCLQLAQLNELIKTAFESDDGAVLGVPVRDSMKRCEQGVIVETVCREQLWQVQTPQMFAFEQLYAALKQVITDNLHVTDEASAIELLGRQPKMVTGCVSNIKITWPEDLACARRFVSSQAEEAMNYA